MCAILLNSTWTSYGRHILSLQVNCKEPTKWRSIQGWLARWRMEDIAVIRAKYELLSSERLENGSGLARNGAHDYSPNTMKAEAEATSLNQPCLCSWVSSQQGLHKQDHALKLSVKNKNKKQPPQLPKTRKPKTTTATIRKQLFHLPSRLKGFGNLVWKSNVFSAGWNLV